MKCWQHAAVVRALSSIVRREQTARSASSGRASFLFLRRSRQRLAINCQSGKKEATACTNENEEEIDNRKQRTYG